MNQLKGMWRDTWWLWTIFFILATLGCIFVSWMICVMFPVMGIVGVYFAFVRYDDNGQERKK